MNGVGDPNVSRTLGQIRENSVFRDLCTIVWGNSDAMPFDTKKRNFFFGKRTNMQIAMEYCMLSFIKTEECRSELDESDLMMMDEFQKLFNFYKVKIFRLMKIGYSWTFSISLHLEIWTWKQQFWQKMS